MEMNDATNIAELQPDRIPALNTPNVYC